MSKESSFPQEDRPDQQEFPELSKLLADDAIWAEPSPDLEDRVLAAIAAEQQKADHRQTGWATSEAESIGWTADQTDAGGDIGIGTGNIGTGGDDQTEPVVDLDERRARRGGGRRFWPLAAAAAVLIIAASGMAGFLATRQDQPDYLVALAPTELAPGAGAVARINDRPNGAQLVVELEGLDPAPPGSFYEVWLVKEDPRTVISAGTFHMRGDDTGEIEFWSGVSPEFYPIITVTLESEADPAAPGELVLRGEVDLS